MTAQQSDREETFSGPGIPANYAYIEQYWTPDPLGRHPDLHVHLVYDFFAEKADA